MIIKILMKRRALRVGKFELVLLNLNKDKGRIILSRKIAVIMKMAANKSKFRE